MVGAGPQPRSNRRRLGLTRPVALLAAALAAGSVATPAAAQYGPWDFRQAPPSNARGVPPAPPPAAKAAEPGGPNQAQYAQSQWPQSQWPQAQPRGYAPPHSPQVPSYAPQGQAAQPGYGQAPGYQNPWQYGYPGSYAQPTAAQGSARPPRVELAITNDQPYVQENVLLRLRLISDQGLDRIDPELPSTNDFMLKRVEKRVDGEDVPWIETSSRRGPKGQSEYVYDLLVTLTPLRAGDLELPPIKVAGSQDTAQGGYPGRSTRYEVASDRSRIQVRPVMTSVSPWLPLHDLTLTANLDAAQEVEEGQPVTISLELKAVGATGSQLPSLEGALESKDFRVYREQTLTEGGLSSDKRSLVGKRTEYYTLVPHSGGRLRMPAIQIAWWNVDKGTREVAGLPIRTLKVDGESGPFGLSRYADPSRDQGWSLFWLPMVGLVLLVLGYWGGVWYQRRSAAGQGARSGVPGAGLGAQVGRTLGAALRSAVSKGLAAVAAGAAHLGRRLNPAAALGRARQGLTRALPAPTRLWLCVGAADREADPAAWCQQFQEQTCRNLAFDPKEPLAGLAAKLARVRPGADRVQIERLMQQLDGALYGRGDLDFPRWKRDLRRSLRPRSGALRGLLATLAPRRVYLPELNPR